MGKQREPRAPLSGRGGGWPRGSRIAELQIVSVGSSCPPPPRPSYQSWFLSSCPLLSLSMFLFSIRRTAPPCTCTRPLGGHPRSACALRDDSMQAPCVCCMQHSYHGIMQNNTTLIG